MARILAVSTSCFWNTFNRAWLTTLQRQFDLTEQVLRHQQPLREPQQSLMSTPTLEQLSRELVRLCDSVERHGLVDYQMGVAEEEIMDREESPSPTRHNLYSVLV